MFLKAEAIEYLDGRAYTDPNGHQHSYIRPDGTVDYQNALDPAIMEAVLGHAYANHWSESVLSDAGKTIPFITTAVFDEVPEEIMYGEGSITRLVAARLVLNNTGVNKLLMTSRGFALVGGKVQMPVIESGPNGTDIHSFKLQQVRFAADDDGEIAENLQWKNFEVGAASAARRAKQGTTLYATVPAYRGRLMPRLTNQTRQLARSMERELLESNGNGNGSNGGSRRGHTDPDPT